MAPALLVFLRISAPFVFVIERSAAALIARASGCTADTRGGGHSPEELKFIVESSRHEGHLEGFEEDAIQKLLELKDVNAREIMTPRIDIVSVSVDATLDELLRITVEHKYSRLPVYQGKPEHIIGILHYKDLMRAWQERKIAADRRQPARPFPPAPLLRDPLVVPETKPLNQLVDEFRKQHTHLAMVVDEFGTITGLVTLEDVLEQIFGEIGDEHDVRRPLPVAGAPVIEVDGSTNIRDLASQYEIELPGDAGFETLAGFLLFRLGYIPAPGESVTYGSRTFIVQEMDRNRIARVKIITARAAGARRPSHERSADRNSRRVRSPGRPARRASRSSDSSRRISPSASYGVASPDVKRIAQRRLSRASRNVARRRTRPSLHRPLGQRQSTRKARWSAISIGASRNNAAPANSRLFTRWLDRYVDNWGHTDGLSLWLLGASIANDPTLIDKLDRLDAIEESMEAPRRRGRAGAIGRQARLHTRDNPQNRRAADSRRRRHGAERRRLAAERNLSEEARRGRAVPGRQWRDKTTRLVLRYAAEKMTAARQSPCP